MMTPHRPKKLRINAVELDIPVFFPSVSSVKTTLPLLDYVQLLNALSAINGQFLVSAFDLYRLDGSQRKAFQQELASARDAGTVVLMDSGNYESYWKDAQSTWLHCDFHHVLQEFSSPLAFGFDEQLPPSDPYAHLLLLDERHKKDQEAAGFTTIIPIIHGKPEDLPYLCAEFLRLFDVPMLGVPERRLGDGIFERVRTISAIRQALDAKEGYVGLHLLGTGNPISIAIYSIAGADSFDGLEWCQTVVDHETGLLFHLSQADFFMAQTNWGDEGWPFQPRVLAHNLEFYSYWMARLQGAIHNGKRIEFCRLNFPRRVFVQCSAALGWEDLA
jgi:queuine/archaeosine tRNA-ribosyltransferase